MNTINISDDMLKQVMQTSGLTDKTQAVTFALQAFINKNLTNTPIIKTNNTNNAIDEWQWLEEVHQISEPDPSFTQAVADIKTTPVQERDWSL